MLAGILAGCEKKSNRMEEKDAAVSVRVTDPSGRPVPGAEIGVYTSGQYEAFREDVTVAPLQTLRTNRRGEAGMRLDHRTWFAGASTTEVYFVYLQYASPQNYQFWSAGGTVKAGETRTFSIVTELPKSVRKAEPEFEIENGVLLRYTGEKKDVVLPAEVKKIAARCFAESDIRRVKLNEGLEAVGAFAFYKSAVEEVDFPSTLKELGEHAFEDCTRLWKADLSRTALVQIPAAAFWGAGLTELHLPATLQQIGAQAFLDTRELRAVTLPESVASIGAEAFRDSGLESVRLSHRLALLGERAFYACTRLKEVRAAGTPGEQKGVVEVGCFENCPLLEAVELPAGTVELKGWTFIGCDRLTSVVVPERVTRIGYDGLDGGKVREVTFRGTVPPLLDRALPPVESLEAIHVPAAAVRDYQEKYPDYADKVRAIE